MKKNRKIIILAAILSLANCGAGRAWSQSASLSILRMRQSDTTSKPGFPKYLSLYRVLDGAQSPARAHALRGTISVRNHTPYYSEVLWQLVYWKRNCPPPGLSLHPTLAGAASIWSGIVKNPSQSISSLAVNIHFPHPLPITGCLGLYHDGGPLMQGAVTISADLRLSYRPVRSHRNTAQSKAIDLSGEYCFGQGWGCQNATKNNREGFAVPVKLPAGHLAELSGNVSDSAFDGTSALGPLPTGKAWGAVNDFYLLHSGCGRFEANLNPKGFPNPAPLAALRSWLPADAVHLASVTLHRAIAPGKTGRAALQQQVEKIFPQPLAIRAGDCIVVIYGRTGNGATDNETQMRAILAP